MTKPPPTKNSTHRNGKKGDDLTRLKGIGPVKQQWLKTSLNICTVQELADFSADEIESRFKAEGQTVSKSEIEGWIAQARELVALEEQPPQPILESSQAEPEASFEPPMQNYPLAQAAVESAEVETDGRLTSLEEDSRWRTCSSFLVEFQSRQTDRGTEEQQTTVRHLQADNVQIWSGIEKEKLHQWIVYQLDKTNPRSTEARTEAETSRLVSPVTVEIDQIEVWQPPQAQMPIIIDRANRLFSGIIRSDQPLALEVGFKLTELDTPYMPNEQVRYLVQCYARDRSTRAITSLGETTLETFVENQHSYKVMLPVTTLEQPGMYRLQVLVTLQGTPATPAYFEVPLLPVV